MKRLTRYTNARFDRLEKRLKQYQSDHDVETLHGIRVEIKKIKVLLALTNHCIRRFKGHRNFVPLRTIFREAGTIRQPDIFYKLLLRYQIKGVSDNLVPHARTSNKLRTAFLKEIPNHVKTGKRQKEVVLQQVKKVSGKCIDRYIKLRKKALREELYPKLHLDRLHKARKVMKEIIYLSRIVKGSVRKQGGFYRKLEALVGQWHDRQMLTFELIRNKTTDEVKRLTTENEHDISRITRMVKRYYKKN